MAKPGRKAVPAENKKSIGIYVRVSPNEREMIDATLRRINRTWRGGIAMLISRGIELACIEAIEKHDRQAAILNPTPRKEQCESRVPDGL